MLRVNAGLSRKLSQDFNSTGFSINVDGEIGVAMDDPEFAIEKIRELFDLADEALKDQISRHQSADTAGNASRNENPPPRNRITNSRATDQDQNRAAHPNHRSSNSNGRPKQNGNPDEPATNKQVQYLLNLSKRQGLSQRDLESRIGDLFGRVAGIYDLTKKEAGELLDELTGEPSSSRR